MSALSAKTGPKLLVARVKVPTLVSKVQVKPPADEPYELDINIQRIEFGPARMRAMVATRVTIAFQPLSGRRMENTVPQQFLLAREGNAWRIEGVK